MKDWEVIKFERNKQGYVVATYRRKDRHGVVYKHSFLYYRKRETLKDLRQHGISISKEMEKKLYSI